NYFNSDLILSAALLVTSFALSTAFAASFFNSANLLSKLGITSSFLISALFTKVLKDDTKSVFLEFIKLLTSFFKSSILQFKSSAPDLNPLEILFLVFSPCSGANNIPATAPIAAPAIIATKVFPVFPITNFCLIFNNEFYDIKSTVFFYKMVLITG